MPFALRASLWWGVYCRTRGQEKRDLRVVVGWGFLFLGFWEIAACVNSGVTLKGLRGVENAVVAVEAKNLVCLMLSLEHSWLFFLFSMKFYKRLPTAIISSFGSNVSRSKQQSWFSSSVSWLPCSSAPVSFKDSYSIITTCISPSLYDTLMGHISIPEQNKRILQTYKDALIDLARPDVPYKTKKRVLVQEVSGFIEDLLAPVVSSLGFLMP